MTDDVLTFYVSTMKTEILQLRLSAEDRLKLERAARKAGISMSEFVRRACNSAFAYAETAKQAA